MAFNWRDYLSLAEDIGKLSEKVALKEA